MSEVQRNLAVSARPQRFSDVIGYGKIIERIKSQFNSGRIPTAMMFVGDSRAGKTTLARIVATSVNCEHNPFGDPCDECFQMAEDHTYEIEERNAALLNKVEDARELVTNLAWLPQAGKFRTFILDECQMMTKPAQNVMLKALEDDKNGFNIFIFGTTDPADMLPALRKRCGTAMFTLEGLDDAEVKRLVWTMAQRIEVAGGWNNDNLKKLWELLVERDIRMPGDIVNSVEVLSNGATPEESAVTADFAGDVNVDHLIDALHNQNWSRVRDELMKAKARDAEVLVQRISASFRWVILKDQSPQKRARYSEYIKELSRYATYNSGVMLSALIGLCSDMCDSKVQTMARAA
jgi:DNA polymerase III gamma/tau subunit